MTEPVQINVNKFTKRFTMVVTVHETRRFRLRKWLALRLIRLAAWVLGMGIEVRSEPTDG
jgi:hypothetical protein